MGPIAGIRSGLWRRAMKPSSQLRWVSQQRKIHISIEDGEGEAGSFAIVARPPAGQHFWPTSIALPPCEELGILEGNRLVVDFQKHGLTLTFREYGPYMPLRNCARRHMAKLLAVIPLYECHCDELQVTRSTHTVTLPAGSFVLESDGISIKGSNE